eukprot:TRINITY_DN3841_c0_g1_i1.p1 TRINITY_DN3841_c0_g1~~TRINITY_DN3841_c0_g1_i1.p1  ORF type:complete len:152 (+),score=30.54 TRINITY_DN3841_c0_g1_i1:46-456(+)
MLPIVLVAVLITAQNCGHVLIDECTSAVNETECTNSYLAGNETQGTQCVWNTGACENGTTCDIIPLPTTPAPSTDSPPQTPSPSSDDLSDGVKIAITFATYFTAIAAGIGGTKAYRHFYPPETVIGGVKSKLLGKK